MGQSIRDKMRQELQDKTAFELAKHCAYQYLDDANERPVYPTPQALAALENFVQPLGQQGTTGAELVTQLHQFGSPATVAQIGGRYHGLVNGGAVPAALAAKWLADVWDQNTPLHISSPVVSTLETVVQGWLNDLFALPKSTVAGFVSGSSMAILCGLAAGRFRLFEKQGWNINKQGFSGAPKLRLIACDQAHGTVLKAAALLGFGIDNIEWIPADNQGRTRVDAVPLLDDTCLLVLQAGNVNSGAFDDLNNLCQQSNKAGAWVHIDGAFGLWAACSESLKHLTQGMALAHSYSVDGHKTLNTPYDCGIVLCQDEDALVNALQASGSYILYSEQRDGMLYTPEMSRRARIVELWASLKYLGRSGIDELVTGLHLRARQLAGLLSQCGFRVLNEVVFNQVLVTVAQEEKLPQLIKHIQDSGECWVGGATWQGKSVIRISICSWATTEQDIERTAAAFQQALSTI